MNKFEETLEEIRKKLSNIKEILIVYVYGSVARGDFSERHSDLDLFVVISKKKVSDKVRERINNKLVSLGLKHGVKVHIEYQGTEIQQEDQTLMKKIIEEGKVVYATGVFTVSSAQLGLKQYLIYSYSLKNSPNKTMFSKALHGRKSWYYSGKKKVIKVYNGIADNERIILLGKGHLMVAKEKQNDIEMLFQRFMVQYKLVRVVYA